MTGARVVVVGGGIAGLAAARAASESHSVTLLEAGPAVGGKLRSGVFRGRTIDLGADAFITRNGAAERLCNELELAGELITPSAASAAVFARGRLRPFPRGLALGVPTDLRALSRSGIVSPLGTVRAALDLFLTGRTPTSLVDDAAAGRRDPTVAELVRPRLGREVLDALVDPLIGGINASDVNELSFVACAPQLAASLAGKRSMMRALRPAPTAPGAGPARPLFYGLESGLGGLVEALRADLVRRGVTIVTNARATSLSFEADRDEPWVVGTENGRVDGTGVVLALPAPDAANVLLNLDAALADRCASIPYAGVVTVTLAWSASAASPEHTATLAKIAAARGPAASGDAAALPGSGVLVPRTGRRLITAATFTSTKWPRSANPGEIVVRASAGRHGDARALALDDDELTTAVRGELEEILGIREMPLETRVQRWPASFPQYTSGHLFRVAQLREHSDRYPGLALCGAAYDGIGIPACIDSGEKAAVVAGRTAARPAS